MSKRNQNNLKIFFIKLIAITFSIIVIINATYNLILADKLENFNKILQLNQKENIESVKNKIRSEIQSGLEKDNLLNKQDKILLYKFYRKIKKEFDEIEK
jgi:cell division protein YceG involved in septum cleavage|tara:strand:- start:1298 stop:1597 length:300 start_codon:yes stop_codon:yes gene_type:complete